MIATCRIRASPVSLARMLAPRRAVASASSSAAVQVPVAAPSPRDGVRGEEVRIPFPGFRLRTFEAESRDVVYIQDRRRDWYRAEVMGPCLDLPFARAIGIDTRGSGSFDRFSAVLVEGERCQLTSLTRSEGPPKKMRKRRRG
jgi:hypothetical protein